MILVDTSVWIYHLRSEEPLLTDLLEGIEVTMHPYVLGELACGNLENRRETLRLLGNLPMAPTATEHEILEFIEHHTLMGQGIGYIDIHLLASTMLDNATRLWTRDRRLSQVAEELELAFSERQP
ncbi:MAG: type II toxin-antitoxin system VapC family toxin [Rubrobacteraceae bacterium]